MLFVNDIIFDWGILWKTKSFCVSASKKSMCITILTKDNKFNLKEKAVENIIL